MNPSPYLVLLSALAGATPATAQTAMPVLSQATLATQAVLEEVVVTGRRPGPPLWRVINGERTLWVFAVLSPLHKDLSWDADSVAHILSESQAYLEAPQVSASTSNPFKALGIMRKLGRAERLPKGTTLKTLLEPELYARLETAHQRYAPKDDKILRLKPLFAANKLHAAALQKVGLRDSARIYKTLRKMAKRAGLEVTASVGEVDVDRVIEVIEGIPHEAQLRCLHETLQSVTEDIQGAMVRANAWATGDATALRALDYPDVESTCHNAVNANEFARAATTRAREQWLVRARQVLNEHTSAFASLPVYEVIGEDGLLGRLAAEGYQLRGQ